MKLWGSIVQVRLRRIGGDSSGEICLKQEQEQDTHLHVGRTKDWQYLVLNANSKSTSEVRRWRPITPRAANAEQALSWPALLMCSCASLARAEGLRHAAGAHLGRA